MVGNARSATNCGRGGPVAVVLVAIRTGVARTHEHFHQKGSRDPFSEGVILNSGRKGGGQLRSRNTVNSCWEGGK